MKHFQIRVIFKTSSVFKQRNELYFPYTDCTKSVYLSAHSFFFLQIAPKQKWKSICFRFPIIRSNIKKRMTKSWPLISFLEKESHYFCPSNTFLTWKRLGGPIWPLLCGFSKTVFSMERAKPWFFVTFNIIIRETFPEDFNVIP